jgi:hypothetical protein
MNYRVSDRFCFLHTACWTNLIQLGWFWWKYRTWEFLYRSICHFGLLYHYRLSFVLGVPHHFYPLPLSFFLLVLPDGHILGVHTRVLSFLFIVVLSWLFLPSTLEFFYSSANKNNFKGKALCRVQVNTGTSHIYCLTTTTIFPSVCTCKHTYIRKKKQLYYNLLVCFFFQMCVYYNG